MTNSKSILLACLILLSLGVSAWAPKKKVKRKKATRVVKTQSPKVDTLANDPRYANTMLLCAAKQDMPVWYLAIDKSFQFPEGFNAPANYKLLSISEKQLNDYLASVPFEKRSKHITLPLYIDGVMQCVDMDIERNVTMDSVLQAKYPQLMSFRAFEKGNELNTARIECDGEAVKMMITYQGETYFVNQINHKGKKYFASYAKNDPNFIKKQFER
jgi:hypothetical protein